MASAVPGPNGIEESISNLSGDTLLLTDDDTMFGNDDNGNDDNGNGNDDNGNEDNAGNGENDNVNTYANILQRENATTAEPTPSLNTDGEEVFLGHGRVLTNIERTHFARDNVTPGRPCTAYFNAEYFVDSKAVFDQLSKLDIPRESVLCLQRRPSGDTTITFTNEAVKKKFVSHVVLRFRENLSVINDEDMPLTFLNIYDAPYELPDEALTFRLRKYCIVHSTRRGKFARSHVNNGVRHFRVQIIQPLPSYLRFGKFLVRLSHDGQQHTCRRCNRAGHFAHECQNVICFNCEELGHQSKECGGPVLCCICKSPDHRARRCPFAWHKSSESSAPSSVPAPGPSSGGHVAAPAGDPPSVPVSSCVPSSGGDVTASASVLPHPSVRYVFSDLSDSALLAAAGSVTQPSAVSSALPSGFNFLDPQGLLRWEKIAFGRSVPNPPGPQSSAEELGSSAEQSADLPAVPSSGPSGSNVSTVSADQPNDSVDLFFDASADPSSVSADPPIVTADPSDVTADPSDVTADPSAVLGDSSEVVPPPVDQSVDSPVAPPVIVLDDSTTGSSDASTADRSESSPAPPAGKSRPSGLPRRKPAPMPAALEALTRRPTRPSLPATGKSSTPSPSPDDPPDEMETQSSLKRKQLTSRKKGDPKKGKH